MFETITPPLIKFSDLFHKAETIDKLSPSSWTSQNPASIAKRKASKPAFNSATSTLITSWQRYTEH